MTDTTPGNLTPADEPAPARFHGLGPAPGVNVEVAMLCDHLLERGVQRFRIDYAGSDDAGGTEGWSTEPAEATIDPRIAERIVDLAEQWTCDCNFNQEGCHGTFRLWPGPKLVEQVHFAPVEGGEAQALPDRHLSRKLRNDLKAHGVYRVTVRWEAAGDAGTLEDWQAFTRARAEVQVPSACIDRLEERILDGLPYGCEINEGSYGTITVQVGSGVVRYAFYNRLERHADGPYTRWRLLPEAQEGKEEEVGEPVPSRPE